MEVVRTVAQVRACSRAARQRGGTVGLVPTMGYLHEGHYSLIRAARERCDLVVVSLFVNPTQFAEGEDLDSYPADLERDRAGCAAEGCDVLWIPDREELYPNGFGTWIEVRGALAERLCGIARPTHFRGVTTIVAKLLNAVEPHAAFFGEKDYQQLRIVRRMVLDLDLPVEIVGCPIVREPDGLAMSSRNAYLSPEERSAATVLRRALDRAVHLHARGERDPRALEAAARDVIASEPLARIDYAEVLDAEDLTPVERCESVVLALAVQIGPARLLDNQLLPPPSGST